jgi:hypothetical protein
MNKDDALKLALEALESVEGVGTVIQWKGQWELCHEAINAIKVALAQSEPTPKRKPLTDEKKAAIAIKAAHFDFLADYVEAITFVIERTEAAHGIKENT